MKPNHIFGLSLRFTMNYTELVLGKKIIETDRITEENHESLSLKKRELIFFFFFLPILLRYI